MAEPKSRQGGCQASLLPNDSGDVAGLEAGLPAPRARGSSGATAVGRLHCQNGFVRRSRRNARIWRLSPLGVRFVDDALVA